MKTSVCVTVYNEEDNISSLLDSLLKQSKKPTEIVIVDGGSTDKTIQIIKHFQKKDKRIKLLVEKGSIAHGRNTAIEIAKYDQLAMTDAGCVPERRWLERITKPLRHKTVDVVAGFYTMVATNPMQKAINVYIGVPPERFNEEQFIPSTRSVAFKRVVWEGVGGFSERLKGAGEDTLFFGNVIGQSYRMARVKEARVVWEETKKLDFNSAMGKFFNYAKGDAKTGLWKHPSKLYTSHNIKILFIYFRYLLGLILLVLSNATPPLLIVLLVGIIVYLIWPIYKWSDVITVKEERVWLPVIQIGSDLAVMAGFVGGLF